jgi:hypothetical protein
VSFVVFAALLLTLVYSDFYFSKNRPHEPSPGYAIQISVRPWGVVGPVQTVYISWPDEAKRLGLSAALLGLFALGAYREWRARR